MQTTICVELIEIKVLCVLCKRQWDVRIKTQKWWCWFLVRIELSLWYCVLEHYYIKLRKRGASVMKR